VCVCVGQLGSECAADGFVLCVCVGQLGGECAAGGFVLCVCVCVCVGRGNYMTIVLRTIHLFHEGLSGYL